MTDKALMWRLEKYKEKNNRWTTELARIFNEKYLLQNFDDLSLNEIDRIQKIKANFKAKCD